MLQKSLKKKQKKKMNSIQIRNYVNCHNIDIFLYAGYFHKVVVQSYEKMFKCPVVLMVITFHKTLCEL